MADAGVGEIIAIGAITAASAAASYSQAQAQNESIKNANKSALDANAAQKAQIAAAAADRRAKLAKQYDLYEGAGRVNAADRGVTAAKSTQDIQRSALSVALGDDANIQLNSFLGFNSSNTATASTIYMNQSRYQPELMSGITGGLSGLQAGVGLGVGYKQLTAT